MYMNKSANSTPPTARYTVHRRDSSMRNWRISSRKATATVSVEGGAAGDDVSGGSLSLTADSSVRSTRLGRALTFGGGENVSGGGSFQASLSDTDMFVLCCPFILSQHKKKQDLKASVTCNIFPVIFFLPLSGTVPTSKCDVHSNV